MKRQKINQNFNFLIVNEPLLLYSFSFLRIQTTFIHDAKGKLLH